MWDKWLRIPKFARVLICGAAISSLIMTTIGYLVYDAKIKEDATCLAYTADQRLDQFALTRGEKNRVVAERQVEAIMRAHLNVLQATQMTICPQSWTRWLAWARWRYFFGAKDTSPRWQLVYPIALRALKSDFQYPWPPEWSCVNEVAPTRGPRNWSTRFQKRKSHVGDIENLALYCT